MEIFILLAILSILHLYIQSKIYNINILLITFKIYGYRDLTLTLVKLRSTYKN